MRFPVLVMGMVVVATSACSVLGPKPDSSRYFVLRPMAGPGAGP